jgi:quinohemoprotein ethanol dehydrogenase
VRQEAAWEVKFDRGVNAGVLATAGGLVFQGTTDGRLVAYSDKDGEQLWEQAVNVGIMAPPVSYQIDGEQYVAVLAGIGGAAGGHSDRLDNDNPGHMFAFKLGGKAQAPKVTTTARAVTIDDSLLDASRVDEGRALYGVHCLRCHGAGAASSGLYPDLRMSAPAVHNIWQQIVLEGVYAGNGMASFTNALNKDEVDAIHAYVIHRALDQPGFWDSALSSLASTFCVPVEWVAE